MEVNGIDFDVRVKGVHVEQDSTTREMGYVKVIRETLVLEVLDRFLERNHVPFACNMFFNGPCSSSSGSRIPAVDA